MKIMMLVKPKANRIIHKPTGELLSLAGEWVAASPYWIGLRRSGGVDHERTRVIK